MTSLSGSSVLPDNVLSRIFVQLENVVSLEDDGSPYLPAAVDAFLCAVIDAYGMVGEMTIADKQQVEVGLATARQLLVKCSHDLKGGSFDGTHWKIVLQSVADSIKSCIKQARRTKVLKQWLLCEHSLNKIDHCNSIETALIEFKCLLRDTAHLLELIYKELGQCTFEGQHTKSCLLLCASQIQKCFPLLLHALGDTANGIDAKDYVISRMRVCLQKLKRAVDGLEENDNDENDLGGGMFIKHMDQALSLLAVFDASSAQSTSCPWQDAVDNLLRHAMLIAQVSTELDFKMIHGSAEKVLREYGNLKQETRASERNPSICKLHAMSLSHALEELEQRVCAAVLRMYLKVFSDPGAVMQELLSRSWSPSAQSGRLAEDLSDLVAALDTHTDRITQVALFAIACSADEYRVLGIRSCMASLESLEPQLVPALTALYLQQHPTQRALVRLLVRHWNNEVEELGKLIDGIVDPAALAQVTHGVIWLPTAAMKKAVFKHIEMPRGELISLVRAVLKQAGTFARQLQLTMKELGLGHESVLGLAVKELVLALGECKAVLKIIESDEKLLSLERVVKRCELLVSCVQRVQPLLEEVVDPLGSPEKSILKLDVESVPIEDPSVQCKPAMTPLRAKEYARLGLPPDADIEIDVTDTADLEGPLQAVLDSTAAQSRLMTSFLYKEKSALHPVSVLSTVSMGTPRPRLFSRSHHQNMSQQVLQRTLCLDITDILEELTSVSQTFQSKDGLPYPPTGEAAPYVPSARKMNFDKVINEIKAQSHFNAVSRHQICSGSAPSSNTTLNSENIGTPERLRDLDNVQRAIEFLELATVSRPSLPTD